MTRLAIVILLAAAVHAQTGKPTGQPPAAVDKALRARVTQFYQAYVDGRFRDAEPLVAADTKNFFYAAAKPQYLGFEISGIQYSDKFTHASVLSLCKQQLMIPGFVNGPVAVPVTSYWKIEKGKWFWWVDPTVPADTPFGPMGGAAPGKDTGLPSAPPSANFTDPAFALHKVSADKESIALKAGGAAEVTFSSRAQGPMSVILGGKPPGFDIAPPRADLAAGGKATVTVKALPDAPQTTTLIFRIDPTGETIEIKVAVN